MVWNRFPDRKPFYLVEAAELEKKIPHGTPIYEHGKSLATLRYFPDEAELEARLIDLAASKDAGFYDTPGWRDEFHQAVREYREEHGVKGRYETVQEQNERIETELAESKRRIEEGLGHPIVGICWPGGGVTKEVVQTAKRVGYRYFTLPSVWRKAQREGYFTEMIPRVGSLTRVALKGKDLGCPSKADFKYHLRSYNGYRGARWMAYYNKLKRLLLGPRDHCR